MSPGTQSRTARGIRGTSSKYVQQAWGRYSLTTGGARTRGAIHRGGPWRARPSFCTAGCEEERTRRPADQGEAAVDASPGLVDLPMQVVVDGHLARRRTQDGGQGDSALQLGVVQQQPLKGLELLQARPWCNPGAPRRGPGAQPFNSRRNCSIWFCKEGLDRS